MNEVPIYPHNREKVGMFNPHSEDNEEHVVPLKLKTNELAELFANKEQNLDLKKEQTKHSRRERQLLKEISSLKVQVATLESEKNTLNIDRKNIRILNLLSILCIAIGSGMVGSSFQNLFGWLFIVIGAILFILYLKW